MFAADQHNAHDLLTPKQHEATRASIAMIHVEPAMDGVFCCCSTQREIKFFSFRAGARWRRKILTLGEGFD